jgi:hypothetical protein
LPIHIRSSLVGAFVLAGCLLLAGAALAQSTTGVLKGEVVDQADTPLTGVKLNLSSDSLQGSREGATTEDGRFRFMALPPGTYRLDVEKEGFKTIIRTNLVVSQGRTVSIKLVMELPEVGETVEVIDRRPLIDTESTTQSMTLNADFLKNLPSGRSFQDVVQFLPGVTGGGNANIGGGTSQSNQYYLDGSSTTDPVTGTFSMNFNFDAIEDLEVITAGYDARYNQGLGGTINIVTKSGGNTFEGTFSGYVETTGLQQSGNQYVNQARTQFTSVEANASLGGPIIKDRFWFFLSYQYTHQDWLLRSGEDVGRDYAQFPLVPRKWNSHYILAKLTAQPFARNKFTLTFRTDPSDISNLDRTGLGNMSSFDEYSISDALLLWRQGGLGASLSHELQIGGRAVLDTTVSYSYSTIFIQPQSWKNCQERDEDRFCLDEDKQGIETWGGFGPAGGGLNTATSYYNFNRRHNLTIQSDLSIGIDRFLGSHSLDAGALVQPLWEVYDWGYRGNEILVQLPEDSDRDGIYQTEEVSNLSAYTNDGRYVLVDNVPERTPGVVFNAYLQDRWTPTRGLLVAIGLRYMRANLQNNLGDVIIDTNALSWGATLGWDPFRDGKTYLMGSYAQIVDPGILELSGYLNRTTFNFEYYPWDAEQQKWSEDSSRASSPGSNITHPDFVPARNHEIFVRVQREIARDLSAEVSFLYRTFTNMWEDDEVNVLWNHNGTDTVGFRNGVATDVARLRTPQDGYRNYWAFSLVVHKQMSDNFELLASYTYSRISANTAGRGFGDRVGLSRDMDNPTQRWHENGIATSDQPHVFKVSASYDNPTVWKVSEKFSMGYALGGIIDFRSGVPLNRLQVNNWTESYSNYVFKRGTRERLPARLDLDLRASLALKIVGTQVDIIVQVFNLLNSLDVIGADPRALDADGEVVEGSSGAVFATPTDYSLPRRFEVGLRLTF